jgi:hypothetical protein
MIIGQHPRNERNGAGVRRTVARCGQLELGGGMTNSSPENNYSIEPNRSPVTRYLNHTVAMAADSLSQSPMESQAIKKEF